MHNNKNSLEPMTIARALRVRLAIVLLLTAGLAACYSNQGAYVAPNVDLDHDALYFVVYSKRDERSLHEQIAERMRKRGFNVVTGFESQMPASAKYLVEYAGQWQWDMRWYLLALEIRLYRPDNRELIASAHSTRSSLAAKDPADMIDEALDQLFAADT